MNIEVPKETELSHEIHITLHNTGLPTLAVNYDVTVNTLPKQLGDEGRKIVIKALKKFTFEELENGDLKITGRKVSFLKSIFKMK